MIKKPFTQCPFKIGDTVHHSWHGECQVIDVIGSEQKLRTRSASGTVHTFTGSAWQALSFEPWPAPVHKRPVRKGVWIIEYDGNTVLRRWDGTSWRFMSGDSRSSEHVQETARPLRWVCETVDELYAAD